MARPETYTEELGDIICERIACTRSVAEALAFDGAPAISTFWSWLTKYPLLLDKYARGVASRAERDNEELRAVAYDLELPADHKRIIVDTLKWQQARASPKRYGDKIQQELSGPGGGPVRTLDVRGLTAEQIEALASIKLEEE